MTAIITNNNYYETGYNGEMKLRTSPSDRFYVKFNQCTRKPLSFYEESLRAAKLIQQNAEGQDIWLSCSGGIDSEFMARIFLEARIPFKILNTKFKNDYNNYDQQYLNKFCDKYDIYKHTLEIDVEQFMENDMLYYAENLSSISPQFPVNMKLWDSVDGYIVTGNGDPIFTRKPNTSDYYFQVKEKEDTIFRYFLWRGRDGCPGFYVYTPEMLLSFMMESEIMKLFLFGHNARIKSIIGPKEVVYNNIYQMDKRESQNGFEDITHIDMKYRSILMNKMPYANNTFTMSIPQLINQLWPDFMTPENGEIYFP